MAAAITVGIYGAAGYTGAELVRLLGRHPAAELVFATSDQDAGAPVPGTALVYQPHDAVSPAGVDVVFLALPHTASALVAQRALAAGAKVIDLSADLRLDTPEAYQQWYDTAHPAPELLPAPYGLPEFLPGQTRPAVAAAHAVANPGCYPTATLLGLYPLLAEGALAPGAPVIVDAKSGVSGAGRKPSATTHFVEVFGNVSPYKVGRSHRHVGEIEQQIKKTSGAAGPLVFTPHLVPLDRGLLATIYVQLSGAWAAAALQALYAETYAAEPLVQVLPAGQHAAIHHAQRQNACVISVTAAEEAVVINAAIDNLRKGAASQAIQNMNLMFGCDETSGLLF